MSFFREFGTSDWSARLPSSVRRLRLPYPHGLPPSCDDSAPAAISTPRSSHSPDHRHCSPSPRGASTDMQLAAPFSIGMLGWYAWYETGKKFWLFDLYFFGAAATLAKGPGRPVPRSRHHLPLHLPCAASGPLLRRTIWWPGIILYLVMVLPWYIAVQRQATRRSSRCSSWEHNLERLDDQSLSSTTSPSTTTLLVLMRGPYALDRAGSARALRRRHRPSPSPSGRSDATPQRYLGSHPGRRRVPGVPRPLDAFSPSSSFRSPAPNLPGYILPSIPPRHNPHRRLSQSAVRRVGHARAGFSMTPRGAHAASSPSSFCSRRST